MTESSNKFSEIPNLPSYRYLCSDQFLHLFMNQYSEDYIIVSKNDFVDIEEMIELLGNEPVVRDHLGNFICRRMKFEDLFQLLPRSKIVNPVKYGIIPPKISRCIENNLNTVVPRQFFHTYDHRDFRKLHYSRAILREKINLHPDHDFYFYNEGMRKALMKDVSPELYRAYMKVVPGTWKADLFRYAALLKFGGIYNDLSMELFVPVHRISSLPILVYDMEYADAFMIGFMSLPKDYRPLQEVIRKVIENIENNFYGEYPSEVTGSLVWKMFKNSFEEWQKEGLNRWKEDYPMSPELREIYLLRAYYDFYFYLGYQDFLIKDENKKVVLISKRNYRDYYYSDKSFEDYFQVLWKKRKAYKEDN